VVPAALARPAVLPAGYVGSSVYKRLRKELEWFYNHPSPVLVGVDDQDPLKWHLQIDGEIGTPYEGTDCHFLPRFAANTSLFLPGGVFFMRLEFPRDFPFKPPKVRLETKIYHFAISEQYACCACSL
jgi:ubiquitin-protein ligase